MKQVSIPIPLFNITPIIEQKEQRLVTRKFIS